MRDWSRKPKVVFEQHVGQRFDGFEVWDGRGLYFGPTKRVVRAALRERAADRARPAEPAEGGMDGWPVYRFRFS